MALFKYEYKGRIRFKTDGPFSEEDKANFRKETNNRLEREELKKVTTVTHNAGWQVGNEGKAFAQVGKVTHEIPAGEYIFSEDSNGRLWAKAQKSVTDNLVDLPDLPTGFILNQIDKFWNSKERYAYYGFLQKRGIMLYGPPGCGKSSIIALLKKQIVDMGGLVISMGDEGYEQLTQGLEEIRAVEPERPIMTVVEDIETYLEGSNGSNVAQSETDALSLYDGEHQINNVVHVATTNKPDAIADRFMRRPGRFDLHIGLHSPTRATREAYLKSICKNGLSDTDLAMILDKTSGLSLAYMREIATTYLVLEIPLEETISRLKKNSKDKFSAKEGFSVGFNQESNE